MTIAILLRNTLTSGERFISGQIQIQIQVRRGQAEQRGGVRHGPLSGGSKGWREGAMQEMNPTDPDEKWQGRWGQGDVH